MPSSPVHPFSIKYQEEHPSQQPPRRHSQPQEAKGFFKEATLEVMPRLWYRVPSLQWQKKQVDVDNYYRLYSIWLIQRL